MREDKDKEELDKLYLKIKEAGMIWRKHFQEARARHKKIKELNK